MYREIALKTLKNGLIRLFAAEIEKNKCVPGVISVAMYEDSPVIVLRMQKSPAKIIFFLNTLQVYFYVHGMFRLQKFPPKEDEQFWDLGCYQFVYSRQSSSIKLYVNDYQKISTDLSKIEASIQAFVLANECEEVFQSFFDPECNRVQAARVNKVPGYVWVYSQDKPERFIMFQLLNPVEEKEAKLLRLFAEPHPLQIQHKPKMILHNQLRYFFDGKVIRWRKTLYIQEEQAKEIVAMSKLDGVMFHKNFIAVYVGRQPYWIVGQRFRNLLAVDALTGVVRTVIHTSNICLAAPNDKDFFG